MPVAGKRIPITSPKDTRSLRAPGLRAAMFMPLLAALSVPGQWATPVLTERNLPDAVGAFYGVVRAPPAANDPPSIREADIDGLPPAIPSNPFANILRLL